jgi:hypothetical protein
MKNILNEELPETLREIPVHAIAPGTGITTPQDEAATQRRADNELAAAREIAFGKISQRRKLKKLYAELSADEPEQSEPVKATVPRGLADVAAIAVSNLRKPRR